MNPVEIDIEWNRAEDLDLETVWTNPDGGIHDLTGMYFIARISGRTGSDLLLSRDNGGLETDFARGATTLILTRDSLAAGVYRYDVVAILFGRTTLYQLGEITVTEGVSQP